MISAKEVREMAAAIIEKRNLELNLELGNIEQVILNHIDDDPTNNCCLFYTKLSDDAIRALRNLGYTVDFNKLSLYCDDSYTISWK